MSKSDLEAELMFQIRALELPIPEREAQVIPDRRFRFDFCWHKYRLLAEVDGGTWQQGRHTRGYGYESDREKDTLAVLNGWTVLRFTGGQVKSGEAAGWLEEWFGTVEAENGREI